MKAHTDRQKVEWAAANPEKRKEIGRKGAHVRRARIQSRDVEHFTDVEIFERDRWICHLCRTRINRRLAWPHPRSASLDHVIPVSRGGAHVRANVKATHLVCNLRKNNGCIPQGEQLLLIG
ncbi:HNH endonuclease [Micromonospora sp. NPDC005174]|uniref:HNH endonuclease n=1 Tax=Micromonospora sp. NPDC005174 TaxID=3157018 RepID=UPI00339F17F7